MIIDNRIDVVADATTLLESKGFTVLSENQIDAIDEKIETNFQNAKLSEDEIIEQLESKGFTVLSENQIDAIEEKINDNIEESTQNAKLSEDEIIEQLESKGFTVLSEKQIDAIEEEIAVMVEDKTSENNIDTKSLTESNISFTNDNGPDNKTSMLEGLMSGKGEFDTDGFEATPSSQRNSGLLESLVS